MARWKLTAAHYLNVPGTEWEYEETNRDTGKRGRKKFLVPMYLSPEDPEFQNRDGEVVVAYEGSAERRDVIFEGLPTPDMEPLDDEARAISEAEMPKWVHPIESLPATGEHYSQSLLTMLERQMGEAMQTIAAGQRTNTPAKGIDPDEFEIMKAQMAKLMARNAELEEAQGLPTPVATPSPTIARRA